MKAILQGQIPSDVLKIPNGGNVEVAESLGEGPYTIEIDESAGEGGGGINITGEPGQLIGFGLDGEPTAIDRDSLNMVSIDGDTMTGALAVPAVKLGDAPAVMLTTGSNTITNTPQLRFHAENDTVLNSPVILHGVAEPRANTDAANKHYVDNTVSEVAETATEAKELAENAVQKSGDIITGGLSIISPDGLTIQSATGQNETKIQRDDTTNTLTVYTRTSDTTFGATKLNGIADPTSNLNATNKQYVDTADATKVSKTGDTMTGGLVINTNLNQLSLKRTQNGRSIDFAVIDGANATLRLIGKKDSDPNEASSVRVMNITNPIVSSDAATKGYVDSKVSGPTVSKFSGTITGWTGAYKESSYYTLPTALKDGDIVTVYAQESGVLGGVQGTLTASWHTQLSQYNSNFPYAQNDYCTIMINKSGNTINVGLYCSKTVVSSTIAFYITVTQF